jgi:hypothetical protein
LDDLDEWLEAMHKEMSLFEKHKVWTLVKRENQKVLSSHWVLGVKDTLEGKLKKARFVVCGNNQTESFELC